MNSNLSICYKSLHSYDINDDELNFYSQESGGI